MFLSLNILSMKADVLKIERSLKIAGFSDVKIPVLKVYLAIVLLGKKIPEVAEFFKLKEKEVQHALIVCGVKLKRSRTLRMKLKITTNAFRFNDELDLVA